MRASVAGLAFGVLAAGSAFGQYIISAHSGVVQYVEGTAYLNDNQVEPKIGQLPDIKDNQVFRTAEGKAEVLLTPGVFLRLAENSSVRMVSNKLTDTRVEVLTGSAMVEVDDLAKDNSIMLLHKGNTILLTKHGLYRVDADAGLLKVYDGEAVVKADGGQLTLHKGKETVLTGALVAENFDPKADDELYRWSDRRSGYLAKANVSSANGLLSSSYGGYSGLGYGAFGYSGFGCSGYGNWLFNPMFGMNTYVPCSGSAFSPFGYGFYSPYTVWQAPYFYGGGGGGGGKGIAGVSHSGSSSGKHTPFVPVRGGGTSASHGGSSSGHASSGGGSAGMAHGGSSGFSSGASAGASHAAAPVSAGRGGR